MTKAHVLKEYLKKFHNVECEGMTATDVLQDYMKKSFDFDSEASSVISALTEMIDNDLAPEGGGSGVTVYDTIPENLQEGDIFALNTMLAIIGSSEEDSETWSPNYYKYYAIDAKTLPAFPVYNVTIIINNVAYNYFDGEWHETPVVGRVNEFPSEEDAYELLQYVDQENYIKAGVIIKETPNYARFYAYYNGKVDTNENYISEVLFPEYADSYY